MIDIVERLRGNYNDGIKHKPSAIKLEAAAEIERLNQEQQAVLGHVVELRAEVARLIAERNEGARWRREGEAALERLRAALQVIADHTYTDELDGLDDVIAIARAALEHKP